MFSLTDIFTTKTAVPDGCGVTEALPPPHLRQYIRCFWKCDKNMPTSDLRIIPDCCADIIIPLDGAPSVFVGVSDNSFITRHMGGVFGIRFYAWAVAPFLHIDLNGSFNGCIPVGAVINGFNDLQCQIAAETNFTRQAYLAQAFFSRLYDGWLDADVMNGIYCALKNDCRVTVDDLARACSLSRRTLERRFSEYVGVSPKAMTELLRYQMLWQDSVTRGFSAADSVLKYGYFDEAHLYNDFKKYHGLGLAEARAEYFTLSRFYNAFN